MVEDKKPTEAFHDYKWVRSKENVPEIYGNMVNPSWTLVDVRFRIGQLVPVGTGNSEFVSQEQAAITVAWPYVKVLRNILTELVDSYERANGEIKPIILPHPADSNPTE